MKDIASFDLDALIKEVNALSNLVALCKNHHWEFDHDLLEPEDARALARVLVRARGDSNPSKSVPKTEAFPS